MKIKVSRKMSVGEIQEQFNSQYPFLKLEFLMPRRVQASGQHLIMGHNHLKLENIQPAMKEGGMVVNNLTTVGEVESFFHNHLFDVQVFRRSGNLWLETTMTDGWTLEKQNNHGKEISEFRNISSHGRNYQNGLANGAV